MKLVKIQMGFVFQEVFNIEKEVGNFVVIAPDYVKEGWGYNEIYKGEDRFIKPKSNETFKYDEKSGTFYNEKELTCE